MKILVFLKQGSHFYLVWFSKVRVPTFRISQLTVSAITEIDILDTPNSPQLPPIHSSVASPPPHSL